MALTTAERDRLFGTHCQVPTVIVRTPWQADRVVVHSYLAERFLQACHAAYDDPRAGFVPQRIDSYACRKIRGSDDSWSLHSWALAWDFFATPEGVPPPGGVWKPDVTITPAFAQHFIDRGFRWGRWFTRQDWPHIEWPGGLPTAATPPVLTTPPAASYEEDDMTIAANAVVDTLDCTVPDCDGWWELKADGAIVTAGPDRHLGNHYFGGYLEPWMSTARNNPNRRFLALGPRRGGVGYTCWANDGAFYEFGPGVHGVPELTG